MGDGPSYVVVIGASAGGLGAIRDLVRRFSPDLDACYFVVLHLSETSVSTYLVSKIQDRTPLTCLMAEDGLDLSRNHIYVAPPGRHLMVSRNRVTLSDGAKENRWRPSIDVLFRSAAANYSNRVIGIVLTGLLDDGTAGASAIRRSGGTVIVQDPEEAEYPDMPLSVMAHLKVDHVLKLSEIPDVIAQIINSKDPKERVIPPEDIRAQVEIEEKLITSIAEAEKHGPPSPYTCPDCGGVLYEHNHDAIMRFKCHTGHSFTVRDLLSKQAEEFEQSLWYAIRSLEQKKNLYNSLSTKYSSGLPYLSDDYKKSEEEIEGHITTLKDLLIRHQKLRSK
jgi:two-component system chemotaxis response regulator CheB